LSKIKYGTKDRLTDADLDFSNLKMRVGYMCGVDWQHELVGADCKIYYSLAQLKRARTCWKECGIVKVEVSLKKWMCPQNFKGENLEGKK
jgi:hypothetical protein